MVCGELLRSADRLPHNQHILEASDQTGDGVLLHILTHIDTDHVVFIIKQGLCKGLCKLSLPTPVTRKRKEPIRSSSGTKDCFADEADCLILSHNVLMQDILHVQEFLPLTFHNLSNRDAVHLPTTFAISSSVTLSLKRLDCCASSASFSSFSSSAFSCGSLPYLSSAALLRSYSRSARSISPPTCSICSRSSW